MLDLMAAHTSYVVNIICGNQESPCTNQACGDGYDLKDNYEELLCARLTCEVDGNQEVCCDKEQLAACRCKDTWTMDVDSAANCATATCATVMKSRGRKSKTKTVWARMASRLHSGWATMSGTAVLYMREENGLRGPRLHPGGMLDDRCNNTVLLLWRQQLLVKHRH